MQTTKAMFGISVFKQSITKAVIGEIVQYMDANYAECLVVIVDEPEAHNWLLRGRDSPAHAKAVAERVAIQRMSEVNHTLRRYGLDMPVYGWGWLSDETLYKQNLETLLAYYATHHQFRVDVQAQLHVYLAGYLQECHLRMGRPLTELELDDVALFLLEELAGLAYLHFDRGFSTDVYPDPQCAITRALFTGEKYRSLAKELRVEPKKYRYIQYPATS